MLSAPKWNEFLSTSGRHSKKADMALYNLTPKEKEKTDIFINTWDLNVEEGETAQDTWHRLILNAELPEPINVEEYPID